MEGIKTYTLYAGVNGAGKSTLYWADKPSTASVRLNSDEIVRELGGDWQDVNVQLEAGKLLLQRQQKAFEEGLSINRETTLCGSNIFKSIEKAKALGYQINLRYVGVESSEIAKERIAKRIALGGHGVSENTVDRRYKTSAEAFKKIYPLCDSVYIYDNSHDEPILVALKEGANLIILDNTCKWLNNLFTD